MKEFKTTADVTPTQTNPNGSTRNITVIAQNTSITAGDLIRMGIVAATGNSFCVVLVSNDSHGRVTGEGWQAVNEALTQGGAGADCGTEGANSSFVEMPDTPGTDAKPSAIVTALNATPADAKLYKS